jgi:hypothetical protein
MRIAHPLVCCFVFMFIPQSGGAQPLEAWSGDSQICLGALNGSPTSGYLVNKDPKFEILGGDRLIGVSTGAPVGTGCSQRIPGNEEYHVEVCVRYEVHEAGVALYGSERCASLVVKTTPGFRTQLQPVADLDNRSKPLQLYSKLLPLALSDLEAACGPKNVRACVEAARIHSEAAAHDTIKDTRTIVEYAERAAEHLKSDCNKGEGDEWACGQLASYYIRGFGVRRDVVKGARLFASMCAKGSAESCNGLGVLYDAGQGVAKDKVKAVQLYQKACDGGNAYGCGNLAQDYDAGQGAAQD